VDERAEIAGVRGDHRIIGEMLVDLADDGGEVDAVGGRQPLLLQQAQMDRVQTRDPAARFAASFGAPLASRPLITSCGSAGMPRSTRQTRPISLASGQTWTSGSCGCGAAGNV
jgi:hypothetical protein